jgi:clan AA aspartic protease
MFTTLGITTFYSKSMCDLYPSCRRGAIIPAMGATHVTVAVSNPSDPQQRWEGLFLVDTGSIDCMAPGKHLRSIGIHPRSKRTYELADGSEIKLDIGVASVEFMGELVGVTIIFGEDDIEPILGLTALESVGIEVDPQNQRLKRLPAVRLKSIRPTD